MSVRVAAVAALLTAMLLATAKAATLNVDDMLMALGACAAEQPVCTPEVRSAVNRLSAICAGLNLSISQCIPRLNEAAVSPGGAAEHGVIVKRGSGPPRETMFKYREEETIRILPHHR